MAMNLQGHHVIPEELEDFLLRTKGIDWETYFSGVMAKELQSGPHGQYTEKIMDIITKHLTVNDLPTLQAFAKNLVAMIEADYQTTFPNDIPQAALEGCFPNVIPQSSSGRTLKPVIRG